VRLETVVVGAPLAGKVGKNAEESLALAIWRVNGESQNVPFVSPPLR
jgi:hypothetical protein